MDDMLEEEFMWDEAEYLEEHQQDTEKWMAQLQLAEDHQTLMQQGKMVQARSDDGTKKLDPRPNIFLSHQWVGDDSPDPDFAQFSVFQKTVFFRY